MRKAAFVALALVAGAAAAQDVRQPDPRDPSATVPRIAYRSAFEDYRPLAEPQARNWRKANEEVGAAGGHKDQAATPGAREDRRQSAPANAHRGHHK